MAKSRKRKASPHPYVAMRPQPDGSVRPRFKPGPAQRKLGYDDEDLKHRDGRWLTFEEACVWAKARHAEILLAAELGARPKKAAPERRLMEDLLRDFLKAMRVRTQQGTLAAKTLSGYAKTVDAVIYTPQTRDAAKERRALEKAGHRLAPRDKEFFSQMEATDIGAPELREFFNYAKQARGHHMAIAMIGVISAAFTWGRESARWRIEHNPRIGMQFDRPEGRVMLIPVEQFLQIVAGGDLIGRPSIGDSWYLGLLTGQRQTDRLALEDAGLIDGRRRFKQSKTGVSLLIKETPMLTERLAQAAKRVATIKMAKGTRPTTIVVDEATGRPYVEDTYRHWVSEARRAATHGVILFQGRHIIADPAELGADFRQRMHNQMTWLLHPMPDCASKRDQDLRDTCVILMFRSGVSIDDISEITGHSKQSAELIREHYLGRNNIERADAAIDRLAAFVAREMAG